MEAIIMVEEELIKEPIKFVRKCGIVYIEANSGILHLSPSINYKIILN